MGMQRDQEAIMSFRAICGAAAMALVLAVPTTKSDLQAAAGPFAALAGSWSGGGTLTMSSGAQERMRCRASYTVGGGGENVRLNIRCASDSFNFDLASDVESRDGRLSGEWSESSRNAVGTITGRANGSRIQAQASSPGFSANLSLTTKGNRQSVAIAPQGTDVEKVSLTLTRQ
jgi:hypothetical protein